MPPAIRPSTVHESCILDDLVGCRIGVLALDDDLHRWELVFAENRERPTCLFGAQSFGRDGPPRLLRDMTASDI